MYIYYVYSVPKSAGAYLPKVIWIIAPCMACLKDMCIVRFFNPNFYQCTDSCMSVITGLVTVTDRCS